MDAGTGSDYADTHRRLSRLTLGVVHDPLTGLRNRLGLLDEIARDPSLAERIETHTSIVVSVEQAIPNDKMLVLVGMRISRSIRAIDTAAHLGNGQFVVIVAGDADVPMPTALRLRRSLNLPYVINGCDVPVRFRMSFTRLRKANFLNRSAAFVEAAPVR
jgi:diguanylate cyclase